MFPIDRNITMPARCAANRKRIPTSMYPFAAMQVGDSFFVKKGTHRRMSPQLVDAGRRYKAKCAARLVSGGLRVWRVA